MFMQNGAFCHDVIILIISVWTPQMLQQVILSTLCTAGWLIHNNLYLAIYFTSAK